MNTFIVLAKGNSFDPVKDVLYVEEGFSCAAAAFNLLWALYHYMWMPTIIFFTYLFSVYVLRHIHFFDFNTAFFAVMGFMIYLGFSASDWFVEEMEAKGYRQIDVLFASNLDDAKLKFIKKYIDQNNTPNG